VLEASGVKHRALLQHLRQAARGLMDLEVIKERRIDEDDAADERGTGLAPPRCPRRRVEGVAACEGGGLTGWAPAQSATPR
jgi:hypothetical protein